MRSRGMSVSSIDFDMSNTIMMSIESSSWITVRKVSGRASATASATIASTRSTPGRSDEPRDRGRARPTSSDLRERRSPPSAGGAGGTRSARRAAPPSASQTRAACATRSARRRAGSLHAVAHEPRGDARRARATISHGHSIARPREPASRLRRRPADARRRAALRALDHAASSRRGSAGSAGARRAARRPRHRSRVVTHQRARVVERGVRLGGGRADPPYLTMSQRSSQASTSACSSAGATCSSLRAAARSTSGRAVGMR